MIDFMQKPVSCRTHAESSPRSLAGWMVWGILVMGVGVSLLSTALYTERYTE